MVTFIGFCLVLVGFFIGAAMREMGLFQRGVDRASDWVPIVPMVGGIVCLLWAFGVMCIRVLP